MSTTEGKLRGIEERLERLEETVEALADRKLLGTIKRALDDIKKGRYKDYDDVSEFRAKFEAET